VGGGDDLFKSTGCLLNEVIISYLYVVIFGSAELHVTKEGIRTISLHVGSKIMTTLVHSFTGAYSPGWAFGLPFGVS
jgi:hypothetical protein